MNIDECIEKNYTIYRDYVSSNINKFTYIDSKGNPYVYYGAYMNNTYQFLSLTGYDIYRINNDYYADLEKMNINKLIKLDKNEQIIYYLYYFGDKLNNFINFRDIVSNLNIVVNYRDMKLSMYDRYQNLNKLLLESYGKNDNNVPMYEFKVDIFTLNDIVIDNPYNSVIPENYYGYVYAINCVAYTKEFYQELIKNKKIFKCDLCNAIHFTEKDKSYKVDNITICQKCYNTRLFTCPVCGELFIDNNSRQGLCYKCYKQFEKYKVNNYSFQPPMKYYYDNSSYSQEGSNFSGIGVELEVDSAGENCFMSKKVQDLMNNEVYIKHDGSLSKGFEIISYPHTINSFFKMNWEQTLMELIKTGYRSHDIKTCGLHLHISRNLIDNEMLSKIIYFYEKYRDDVILFSRRDKAEADKWSMSYRDLENGVTHNSLYSYNIRTDFPQAFRYIDCAENGMDTPSVYTEQNVTNQVKLNKTYCDNIVKKYNDKNCHEWRYTCVNLQKSPTIEFRIMRGTLNYKTFLATVEFLIKIVENSKNIRWKNIDNLKLWLKGMSKDTIKYMKKRKCFGYTSKRISKECDFSCV